MKPCEHSWQFWHYESRDAGVWSATFKCRKCGAHEHRPGTPDLRMQVMEDGMERASLELNLRKMSAQEPLA